MQKTIKQILEGEFQYDNGSLDFSCTNIEITLRNQELYEGSFHIKASEGCSPAGRITTSDRRMECLTPSFTRDGEEIHYRFLGQNMEDGEVVKGEFHIVSDQGEYSLPFVVSKIRQGMESGLGPIKNLFHFTNLAQSNWKEALKLFYSPEFADILVGTDREFRTLYRGLSAHKGNQRNMDEFLQTIHKKRAVSFLTDRQEIRYGEGEDWTEDYIEIEKKGWGYVQLNISCTGSFLYVDKPVLYEEDFTDNVCRLPIRIREEKLKRGLNEGEILLQNSTTKWRVRIAADRPKEGCVAESLYMERKQGILQLMQLYLDMKQKNIANQYWKKESTQLVEELLKKEDHSMLRLFQAQLYMVQERKNEAAYLLDLADEEIEAFYEEEHEQSVLKEMGIMEAYYLYLTTLQTEEEEYRDQVEERVRILYASCDRPWQIAWLLLFLAREYEKNAGTRYLFVMEQLQRGCTSPLMYWEALSLMNANPTVLRRLDKEELRVLYFGARKACLSEELVDQLLYALPRIREFSGVLLRLLTTLYEQNPRADILKEICALLVKGNRIGTKFVRWYEKGIRSGIRITNLYEYYMDSLDIQENAEIPREVLVYYAYQTRLDYRKCAYLYSYVVNKKIEEPELYKQYHHRIRAFVLEQIEKQHMDKNLAFLYREFLSELLIDTQNAGALANLIFAHQITVKEERIRRVIVCHESYEEETAAVLSGGKVWLPIFGNNYSLLLEDEDGNRYAESAHYRMEKLMLPGRYLHAVAQQVTEHPLLDLYCLDNMIMKQESTDAEAEQYRIWRRLYGYPAVADEIKNRACLHVLQYLFERDELRELDSFLSGVRVEPLSGSERMEVLRYLVLREKYDRGYELLKNYSMGEANIKVLVRLVGWKIRRTEYVRDEVLLDYCKKIFARGKYDGVILRYLCMHYEGKVKDMRSIWKAARAYDEDCFELSERILVQMMTTGAYIGEKEEIFSYYLSGGGRPEVEKAYLTQNAYDYFVKDKVISPLVFKEMRMHTKNGENFHKVCKLAYLKYYSDYPEELDEQAEETAVGYLKEMLRQNIRLNCFKFYEDKQAQWMPMTDRTILEYYGRPGSKVMIHYLLQKEDGEDGSYCIEEMKPVFGGVCYKEFVLFFGENVQYYIVEQNGDKEELTQSGTLQNSDIELKEHESRFSRINDLMVSEALKDYEGLGQLLEEYCKLEYLSKGYFNLKS